MSPFSLTCPLIASGINQKKNLLVTRKVLLAHLADIFASLNMFIGEMQ